MPAVNTIERLRALSGHCLLYTSVYASLLIGVTGVIWGLWSDSRIVLFDGIYTVFGTALSGLSLLAAWAAGLSPDKRYLSLIHI